MSMPVDDGAAAVGSSSGANRAMPKMPMVRCNAITWTDETEGAALKLLVTRSDPDPVTGTAETQAGAPA